MYMDVIYNNPMYLYVVTVTFFKIVVFSILVSQIFLLFDVIFVDVKPFFSYFISADWTRVFLPDPDGFMLVTPLTEHETEAGGATYCNR